MGSFTSLLTSRGFISIERLCFTYEKKKKEISFDKADFPLSVSYSVPPSLHILNPMCVAGYDQGLQVGEVLHVHALCMDGQQVLEQHGVADGACGQGGGEHVQFDSFEGVAFHDDQGLQVLGLQGVSQCDCDKGGVEHDGFVSGGYREKLTQWLRCGWSS